MAAAGSVHAVHLSAEYDDDPRLAAIGESAQRKAAWRLLPVIAVGYGLAFMDRINISFASLQMNRDLHFSASVYGFGAGLFFIGYALCEVPSNLLLLRFGAKRWLARIMFTWGLLAAAGLAAMNTIAMFGGFLGPYWMGVMKDYTGSYEVGLRALVIPSLLAAATMYALTRNLARKPVVLSASLAEEAV